jgi:hypothetical protein
MRAVPDNNYKYRQVQYVIIDDHNYFLDTFGIRINASYLFRIDLKMWVTYDLMMLEVNIQELIKYDTDPYKNYGEYPYGFDCLYGLYYHYSKIHKLKERKVFVPMTYAMIDHDKILNGDKYRNIPYYDGPKENQCPVGSFNGNEYTWFNTYYGRLAFYGLKIKNHKIFRDIMRIMHLLVLTNIKYIKN